MRAAFYTAHGDLDQLRLGTLPDPVLEAGDVLVRVRAAALNGFDPMMLAGSTTLQTPFPMIPCGDCAGEIAALGPGVDQGGWAVGQRVSVVPYSEARGMMGETATGGACEYVAVSAANLLLLPEGIGFVNAAALPIAYGTAYRMLFERGGLCSGETVLILGAAGGVGMACVQLAKTAGAIVLAAASTAAKATALAEAGADHVIDTSSTDLTEAVRAIVGRARVSGTGGVDMLVNFVGGATWSSSQRLLRKHGRLLCCGASAGHLAELDLRYLWSFEHVIIGSDGWSADDQRTLLTMVAEKRLQPVIHAVRPLDDIRTAMQEMVDRSVVGKSILLV